MRIFFYLTRFTLGRFLAIVGFLALTAFASASSVTPAPDQDHFPEILAFVMFLGLAAIEGWLFWTAWKKRDREEDERILKLVPQAPRHIAIARTPIQRKKTTRERVKVPV